MPPLVRAGASPRPAPRRLAFIVVLVGLAAATSPAHALLRERITTTSLTLPAALEPSVSSFHLWTQHVLGPRLYHEPLADGRTMVGWTDAAMNGHVSLVGSTVETTFDFPDEPVRGLVAHSNGTFAVLLWNRGGAGFQDDYVRLSKRNANGSQIWSLAVTTSEYTPNPAQFNIGDSRLAYANGVYGAYLSVHSTEGHEGDRYQRVSDSGVLLSGGWGWGLSHSMAGVIAAHPENGTLHTAGVSDCYPSKALLYDKTTSLFTADADCAGKVSVQLGQMAAGPGGSWLVAMDAVDRPGFPARGVAVVRVRSGSTPRLVWLTNTTGSDERDPVIARIDASLGSNRYLVGWRQLSDGSARIAVIDSNATVQSATEIVSPAVTWGARDDSYRTRPDGSISWVEGAAGSRTLRLHRYSESQAVAVVQDQAITTIAMLAPYPNPARGGATTLRFRLDRARHVALRIHDGAGRIVRELLDAERPAGFHEVAWDGRGTSGQPMRSGVYFATIESGTDRASRALLLIR
jgi:FlgD Ig-like domain